MFACMNACVCIIIYTFVWVRNTSMGMCVNHHVISLKCLLLFAVTQTPPTNGELNCVLSAISR